jgi:hypothetical protein
MGYPSIERDISGDELREYFMLTPQDQKLLQKKGGVHRLGLAVFLKVYQFLGYAPRRKKQIPQAIVDWVADQLQVEASLFARYPSTNRAWRRHHVLVREHLGIRIWERGGEDATQLDEWLVEKVDQSPTRGELLDLAVKWCREHRVELPAEKSLRRLVHSARSRFFEQLYSKVSSRLDSSTRARMKRCLSELKAKNAGSSTAEEGDTTTANTVYDWVKSAPGKVGLATILNEVEKLRFIRTFNIVPDTHFEKLSLKVLTLLRDRARTEDAGLMARHPGRVRDTLLAALLVARETEVTDHIVRILIGLIHKIDKKSEGVLAKELLRGGVKTVWGKKGLLFRIAIASADEPDGTVKDVIYPAVGEKVILRLVEEAKAANADYEVAKSQVVQKKYKGHYRRMMKPVLEVLTFRTENPAHKPLLEGVELVKRYLDTNHTYYPDEEYIPESLLTAHWANLVLEQKPNGKGKRALKHQFEVCVLSKLERALKCKEVWVDGAYRFRNPAADLPADWDTVRVEHYQKRDLPLEAGPFLDTVRTEMETRLESFNTFLGRKQEGVVAVRRQGRSERGVFYVPPLPKQDERPVITPTTLSDSVCFWCFSASAPISGSKGSTPQRGPIAATMIWAQIVPRQAAMDVSAPAESSTVSGSSAAFLCCSRRRSPWSIARVRLLSCTR